MNKPTALSQAVIAIWITLGLSALSAVVSKLLGWIASDAFFGTLFLYALFSIIPYKISIGKNWARYFYAVITAIGVAMMLAGEHEGASKLDIALSWILLPVEAWVLYSLFRRDSSEWFESQKPA